jgi:hypothetical protein
LKNSSVTEEQETILMRNSFGRNANGADSIANSYC